MKGKDFTSPSTITKSSNFNAKEKVKTRFSLRKKLILVFGLLIFLASLIEGLLAIKTARNAVTEKIETHLVDKAADTVELIDGKVRAFFQFFEGVARAPILSDPSVPYATKVAFLKKEATFNKFTKELDITDKNGVFYYEGGTVNVSDREWFKRAIAGENFVTEPYIERVNGTLVMTFAVPIYNYAHKIVGVLSADVDGLQLSKDISNIVVGKTGYCYILGHTGTNIAAKDFTRVEKMANVAQEVKTDNSLRSLAKFEQLAVESNESSVDFYTYKGIKKIASYAAMKTTNWTVIISAPIEEFMGTVRALRTINIIMGIIIIAVSIVIVYFVAKAMVKPVRNTVAALKDIAQGDGDLTVRLPVKGNDEVTDLSNYFNQTIEKIGKSIKEVSSSTSIMKGAGDELSANMTETASAVNQINGNVEGVKQQAIEQAAGVTETAATMEEIIKTIKLLNTNIESQAESVAQSSASIEEMVANIASITQTLETSNDSIKNLASATEVGKNTLLSSNTITQKIAEESGSLMEASSVIQHIASQTNLLAMNAAIEAAHAGEAGKGFAVVADEIRKLAEDSAAQGKTITATLKNLGTEIEILSNASKTVEEKFNVIFMLSEQVKAVSETLMSAMKEQENGSKEVLSAIRDINEVTGKVRNGSEEMLLGGEQIAEEMHRLDDLTRIITESMNEMSVGSIQITNAVQEVNEMTQKNKNSIDALSKEVSQFKI
ncbi:MAG: methyl-accepting chemotaxis protein [Treponemataceae bacterium]